PDTQAESLARRSFSSDAIELKTIRDWLREILQQQTDCSEDRINDAILAVNEACMNIIQHAYYGQADGEMIIELFREQHFIIFQLTDFASPVDIDMCQPRDLDDVRPGGLGIHIIQSVMDSMQFLEPPADAGNLLELKLNINKQSAQG
ncbi:MAG: ATP-binding protein, partial [Gammaproteobacteria bacterium]|nr:ATP-binding protein [Gammaproteobacteria bacterium]